MKQALLLSPFTPLPTLASSLFVLLVIPAVTNSAFAETPLLQQSTERLTEPSQTNVSPQSAVIPSDGPGHMASEAPPVTPQLVISLMDGSKLHGATTLKELTFHSAVFGKLNVPLERIASIKFNKNKTPAAVALDNGDRLQGHLGVESVVLQTLVGPVTIPFNVVSDLVVTTAPTDAALSESLVAYYPFNGDAKDHSGNENHGKVVGAEFARVGIQFRGDGGTHVLVPRSASLEPASGITVSMWLKGVPGQIAGHGWGTIMRKSGPCQPGYGFRGGGISSFNIEGQNPCGGTCKGAGFRAFDESRWQHVVGTYSQADGTIKTYQDGELVNLTPLTGQILHSGDLYLGGAVVAGDDGGFRGTMTEVRIYSRALSESEVRALAAKSPASVDR